MIARRLIGGLLLCGAILSLGMLAPVRQGTCIYEEDKCLHVFTPLPTFLNAVPRRVNNLLCYYYVNPNTTSNFWWDGSTVAWCVTETPTSSVPPTETQSVAQPEATVTPNSYPIPPRPTLNGYHGYP